MYISVIKFKELKGARRKGWSDAEGHVSATALKGLGSAHFMERMRGKKDKGKKKGDAAVVPPSMWRESLHCGKIP